MPGKFGLTPANRKALMACMRQSGIDDPAIGRVFGISRQAVGQHLGPHTGQEYGASDDDCEIAALRAGMLDGRAVTEIARERGLSVPRARRLAPRTGVTRAQAQAARSLRQIHHLEVELRAVVEAGWPLTATQIIRYDKAHGTGLYPRASAHMPMIEWRRRLGVESTTLLYRKVLVQEKGR